MIMSKRRIFWIMADSLGVGAMPDAAQFKPIPGGDVGSNTLASLITANKGLKASFLQKLGLANSLVSKDLPHGHPLWSPVEKPLASFGKMAEKSAGKDTPSGHWEMAGVPVAYQMPVYYGGLPKSLLNLFVKRCQEQGVDLPGVLGGQPASGTVIIKELGEESIKTGQPIVYTSGDSVFQIAAHEQFFGLDKLYKICEIARELLNEQEEKIGRVIARPFLGTNNNDFLRTPNRRDYSLLPPKPTVLEACKNKGLEVISIGKIADIYAHQGFTQKIKSKSNQDGMKTMIDLARQRDWSGIAFVNLVDFDMLYGHRRDAIGYAKALEVFDADLAVLFESLQNDDLVIISADHGCDPTFAGTDHTREYVPIIVYGKTVKAVDLGIRDTFADVAATISQYLDLSYSCEAKSLL